MLGAAVDCQERVILFIMSERSTKVRTPLFPLYSEVRKLLPIWQGVSQSDVRGMINAIHAQAGTPQSPVDWSDPDTWIPERLTGKERELAQRIWEETGKTVNPRHVYNSYLFINGFNLLLADNMDVYRLSERGQGFWRDDAKAVREIDELEGLPDLLAILATKPQARRADLLEEWGEFLRQHSTYGTASTISETLRKRLLNLIERGFVEREGSVYRITKKGMAYAAAPAKRADDPKRAVMDAVRTFNTAQFQKLSDLLLKMPPYNFEKLVRDLLEAMGYEDVTVTKQSGDKGVDVVATVQFGITTVTEVVQVKRPQGNLNRTVIDQLRGVLPFHRAIRGTIITTGGFSKGLIEVATFPGAAPITLINGEKLIELLLEHQIAVNKRPVLMYELDASYFEKPDELAAVSSPAVD